MKRIVSGITPSGKITLGNYIGAIRNFIKLQDENELFIFVANLHAITAQQVTSKEIKENIKFLYKAYIACGIDVEKTTLFVQSDVMAQAQMGHILLCHTSMGELSRMTQYKDKSAKTDGYIPTGLFTYPTLMAADILAYSPDLVPTGADQKQHIELTRNIAERINNKYGEVFKIPEPFIPKTGHKVMSLQDPTKKMSKSDTKLKNIITLDEDVSSARKKIMSAVTDTDNKVKYDVENKPGISNLMTILSSLKNVSFNSIEKKYEGVEFPYGEFKKEVADAVCELLLEIQTKIKNINNDSLKDLMYKGALKASKIANRNLNKLERALGLKVFR